MQKILEFFLPIFFFTFLTQISFRPKNFLYPNFFGTKILFGSKNFLDPKVLANIFWDLDFFDPKIFGPNFFLPNFFGQCIVKARSVPNQGKVRKRSRQGKVKPRSR